MEMKQPNSQKVDGDIRYGQSAMIVTTPDADVKSNIDYFIGGFGVAWRKRRIKLSRYKQISIRYARVSGNPTEITKILKDESKSQLYVFEFLDYYVVCKMVDIRKCLEQKKYQIVDNHDNEGIMACYINIADIKHLLIVK